eukprot:1382673-Amorphochlora_amoeboformis.AAC.1
MSNFSFHEFNRSAFGTSERVRMASSLEGYVDQIVNVITNDGRNIVGVLKGYDQCINIILEDCHERVFAPDSGVEQVVLGLYIIRGDNVYVPPPVAPPFSILPFFVYV